MFKLTDVAFFIYVYNLVLFFTHNVHDIQFHKQYQSMHIGHPRHYNTYLMYLRVDIIKSCDVMVGQVISLQIYIF